MKEMEELTKEKMLKICGGGSTISGAVLEAVASCIETIFGIGQAVGSALRRIRTDNLCKIQTNTD